MFDSLARQHQRLQKQHARTGSSAVARKLREVEERLAARRRTRLQKELSGRFVLAGEGEFEAEYVEGEGVRVEAPKGTRVFSVSTFRAWRRTGEVARA